MKIFSILWSSKRAYYSNKKILFLILTAIFVGAFVFGIFSFPSQAFACHEPEECEPEETRPCDTGQLGICASGTQTCDEAGFWEQECVQNSTSSTEICTDDLDNDCDGYTDCDDLDCEEDEVCIPEPEPYCGDGNLDDGEECEINYECGCGYICNFGTCLCEEESLSHTTTTIYAYKIVCESEEDLPDWGNGTSGPSQITATTSIDYVENSSSICWFADGWDFQWGPEGQKQTGSHIGPAPDGTGWNNFDSPTGTSTPAQIQITELATGTPKIWVRENLQEGYIPFANPSGDLQEATSAEMYCHDDILNYDNYDYISNPEPDQTYYCVAFNTLISEPPQPYCGDGIVNGSEDCEIDEDCYPGMSCVECSCYAPITYFISGLKFNDKNSNGLKDNSIEPGLEAWTITIEGPYQFNDSTTTDEEGRYKFSGLIPGSYTICEELEMGWEQTYPTENDGCHIIEIIDGSISEVNFGNYQLPYCGDGNLDPDEECEVGHECNYGYICDFQTCLCEELPGPGCDDNDQDGYYAYDEAYCLEGDDCDDTNPNVNPGTAEVCDNQINDDCDGDIDCDDSDCTGDPVCQAPGPVCGNDILETGEECDDGNTEDGDGCSSECVIELPPQPECTPQATTTCSTGQSGICSAGIQTCSQEGFWGECEQDNEPITEICNNGLDDDCDGDVDCDDGNCEEDPYCEEEPSPPTCTSGDTRVCGTGLSGICSSGIQTCNSQGFWGVCKQDNEPVSEICNNDIDDDCDGNTDCSDPDCMVTLSCYVAPPGPTCLDLDSDGYNAYAPYCLSGTDCDDSNPNINPGVSEICNNDIDDDCDGDIDCEDSDCTGDASCGSGGPVCTDSDGDGYAIEGDVCGPVDCDDTNSNINPEANELCNNDIDDDCDGLTDCDDSDCVLDPLCGGTGGPVCTDSDGDGFSIEGGDCGSVDCDDTNPNVNPLAIELCNNDIDDDCDGLTDCDDSDCIISSFCVPPGPTPECESGEQRSCDTDLMGICSVGTQTCNEQGFWGDCLADYEDSFEICDNGLDDDCDGDTDCDDSDCSGVISCAEGGEEEEEEEIGFFGAALAQVGNFFSNLLASVSDAVSRLLGFFTNGKGLCLCLPSCFPWWFILILFLYSLVRTIRVWNKDNKEKRTWLVWTLILLILTVLFLFEIFICLTFWIFIILLICTYLIYRSLKQKEEQEQTYKLFE